MLGGPLGLRLVMAIRYVLVEDAGWGASTTGYRFRLEGVDGRELVSWHWHPDGLSGVRWPHLHVDAVALAPRSQLTGAHLPTGSAVDLSAVLRLAIADLGVPPRRRDRSTGLGTEM